MDVKSLWRSTFLRFILVGGMNWLLFNVIQLACYGFFGFNVWAANAIAFTLTGIEGFFIARHFVFRRPGHLLTQFVLFFAVLGTANVTSLVACRAAAALLHRLSLLSLTQRQTDVASLVLASALATAVNYLGQKRFAFREAT